MYVYNLYIKYKFVYNGERVYKPDARVDGGGQFKDLSGNILPLNLPTNKMQLCSLTRNRNK